MPRELASRDLEPINCVSEVSISSWFNSITNPHKYLIMKVSKLLFITPLLANAFPASSRTLLSIGKDAQLATNANTKRDDNPLSSLAVSSGISSLP